jgi:hypothetical protein
LRDRDKTAACERTPGGANVSASETCLGVALHGGLRPIRLCAR